jgi:TolB-like protein
MASIFQDYEYDIFISYRQNDNKHDGWVTEFVNNLRGELESASKVNISIYFDENPDDRLLGTYNVNKSLEVKLKSFIFIPIISRTYCDPKSYAWQNEFTAFMRLCEEDRFGKDVKLKNGNVANRILPIRIHNLDPEDVKLFEKTTGNVMRPVDFVYRTSSGVNRPLRANEDNPNDNLNKTYYRDQINKLANAISEIFLSLNQVISGSVAIKSENNNSIIGEISKDQIHNHQDKTGKKSKKIVGFLIVAAVCIISILIFKIVVMGKQVGTTSNLEKSIAILPFRNDSPNDTNTYFINGLMEDVLNHLQMIKDLRVISRTSVEQYRNATKSVPQIAKEQNVNYIVEGSGQKYGTSFTVNVQLIRAVKEDQLWAKSYQQEIRSISDIISVQNKIAESIVEELKATITPEEKHLIEKVHTKNLNAYDFYQRGREDLMKYWVDNDNNSALNSAGRQLTKALTFDSTFADAYASLAEVYLSKKLWLDMFSESYLDSVLILVNRALSYDDQLAEAYSVKGDYYYAKGMSNKALEEYDKTIELNPNEWSAYYGKAQLYELEDPVKYLDNLQKAALINQSGLVSPAILRYIGGKLEVTGFIDKAKIYYKKAFELDGDSAFYLSCLGGAESDLGNYNNSLTYFKRAYMNRANYTYVINRLGEDYQILSDVEASYRTVHERVGKWLADQQIP